MFLIGRLQTRSNFFLSKIYNALKFYFDEYFTSDFDVLGFCQLKE